MTAKIICENKNLEVSDLSNASPVYCKKDEIRIFSLFWELGKHSLRKIVDESFRRTLQSSVKCTSYLMKIWWEYVNMVYPMACESHSVSENFLIHLLRHSYPCFGTKAKNSLLLRNCVDVMLIVIYDAMRMQYSTTNFSAFSWITFHLLNQWNWIRTLETSVPKSNSSNH